MNRLVWLTPAILLVAACGPSTGGSNTGELDQAIGGATSPFAILDLDSGAVSHRASLPDLASNPAYREGSMVFRRVGSGDGEILIGVFEVTQAQWLHIAGAGSQPWAMVQDTVIDGTRAHAAHRPAYNLDYDGLSTALVAYAPGAARLRLPSDSEWTTAAGAGSGWSWGNDGSRARLTEHAVVRETVIASTRLDGSGHDIAGPLDVGGRSPDASGLYDLHGNVWELTAPSGVVRGGSWADAAAMSRIEIRAGSAVGLTDTIDHALVGARLVLVP